ncbi:MAG: GNAT family N-acetyltransferase [Enterococcus durans]
MIYLEELGEEDISEVYQIQKLTFENLYSKYKDAGSPFIESKPSLLEKIKRPNDHFYFIKNSEQIIGYVRIATNGNQTKAKIGPIGIVPKSEEKGYGTKAMLLVEKKFPTVREWYLDTILQESKLIHLYTKLGYKETSQVEKVQEGMDIIFFIKKLDD